MNRRSFLRSVLAAATVPGAVLKALAEEPAQVVGPVLDGVTDLYTVTIPTFGALYNGMSETYLTVRNAGRYAIHHGSAVRVIDCEAGDVIPMKPDAGVFVMEMTP